VGLCLPLYQGVLDLDLRGDSLASLASLAVADRSGELAMLVTLRSTDEMLALIERQQFHDSGCGAIDMALLASVLLTPGTLLWTLGKKLGALAARLGVVFTYAGR